MDPQDAGNHFCLITCLNAQARRDEAIAQYREAIRLVPDEKWLRYNLGLTLMQGGERAEAIRGFEDFLTVHGAGETAETVRQLLGELPRR